MKQTLAILRKVLVAKLQARFGYRVCVVTDSLNVFTHTSWTLADAMAWAKCYPHSDTVAIQQINMSGPKLVAMIGG